MAAANPTTLIDSDGFYLTPRPDFSPRLISEIGSCKLATAHAVVGLAFAAGFTDKSWYANGKSHFEVEITVSFWLFPYLSISF
jgi:hypothetical protein